MGFRAAKISFDGSHYIATPKENFPQGKKRRRSSHPTSEQEAERKEQFETAYRESQQLPRKERKDYVNQAMEEKIPDEEYLKLMAMTIIMRASSTLNKYGTNIYQLASEEEVFHNVREIRSMTDTSECVIKYIKQVCDYHEKKRSGKRTNVIKDALDYVNRNLYNQDLSLKKVATDLYINDSYLSREFKKTYGISFI